MAQPPPANEPSPRTPANVQVGAVLGAHGNDGILRIEPATDNPARFAKGGTLIIDDRTYTVEGVAMAAGGNVLLVKLADVRSREEAQVLAQQPVLSPISDLPHLPDDTYYHYQLIDLKVIDIAGNDLGVLTEIISTGANDVYVVTGHESELMVPALADVVVAVDLPAGSMTVDVPEGIEPRSTTPKPKRHPPRRKAKAPRPKPTSTR